MYPAYCSFKVRLPDIKQICPQVTVKKTHPHFEIFYRQLMLYFHLLVLFPVWQLSQKSVGPRGWSWVTAKRKESRTKWTATEGKVTHVTLMWVGGAHQQEVIQPGRVRWHQWHHWIALAPVNDFFLFDEIHSSEIKRYVLYVNFFESVSWKAMIWLCHCCVLMVNLL